jgi:hypothetical protein
MFVHRRRIQGFDEESTTILVVLLTKLVACWNRTSFIILLQRALIANITHLRFFFYFITGLHRIPTYQANSKNSA